MNAAFDVARAEVYYVATPIVMLLEPIKTRDVRNDPQVELFSRSRRND